MSQHTPGYSRRVPLINETPKGCTCGLSFQSGDLMEGNTIVQHGTGEFGRKACHQCNAAADMLEALKGLTGSGQHYENSLAEFLKEAVAGRMTEEQAYFKADFVSITQARAAIAKAENS